MRHTPTTLAAAFAVALLLAAGPARSAEKPAKTTITVKDMHCANCAKKMAKYLYKVPGVAAVHIDVEKSSLFVTPNSGASPSPLRLWEMIEKAGYEPGRLTGPRGTFTSKPAVR